MKPFVLLLLLLPGIGGKYIILPSNNTVNLICPFYYYGKLFTQAHVEFTNNTLGICFRNRSVDPLVNCVQVASVTTAKGLQYQNEQFPFDVQSRTTSCHLLILNSADSMEIGFFVTKKSLILKSHRFNKPKKNLTILTTYNNTVMESLAHPEQQYRSYHDIVGCRSSSDEILKLGMSIQAANCTEAVCNRDGEFSNTTCEGLEECRDNVCVLPPVVCTVTGSSVIDFHGKRHFISDRCKYSLVEPRTGSEFTVSAGFRERRRKDVSFLDHLIIKHNGSNVTLGQGGMVKVDGEVLKLTGGNATFGLLNITKDQAGVTVKLPSSNLSVLFDGNTAHVSGVKEHVAGLCGNLSNGQSVDTTTSRLSVSSLKCRMKHSDTSNSTSDCQRAKTQCDRIKQSPFTACHGLIDPEPYVSACNETLCSYPEADGFNACLFMGAYAKACSLLNDTLLGTWTNATNCPRQDFCQNHYCSEHEFCGELSAQGHCFCRALYAPTGYFGEPAVCTQSTATKSLANCLLLGRGFNYSKLHLNDPNCRGDLDPKSHMVTFSYSSTTCGTQVMMNNSQVVFKNKIMSNNSTGNITRQALMAIDFSCYYEQPEVNSISFRIKQSSLVQQIVSGRWNYSVMMNAYTDPGLQSLVGPSTAILLNQKVWLHLETKGLDSDAVAVVTDSCWATTESAPNSTMRHDLIIKGCPSDSTVTMIKNGQETSSVFSFNMFQFTNGQDDFYLHCRLQLCIKKQGKCVPTCSNRKARAAHVDPNPALITMIWTK